MTNKQLSEIFDKDPAVTINGYLKKTDKVKEMAKKRIYKTVDLFAGCGGLSLGLEQAGFTQCFVNEIVEQFANTYKVNHLLSDEHYHIGDIAKLNEHISEYKEILTDITLVCGGPPCQGFSMANRQRILDDPRNGLYKQYLIFLSIVRPQFFIMENVRGMMNKIDEIIQNFRDYLGEDYLYDYAVLKPQDFGVPFEDTKPFMFINELGFVIEFLYREKFYCFHLEPDCLNGPDDDYWDWRRANLCV